MNGAALAFIALIAAILVVRRRWIEWQWRKHILITGIYCMYHPQPPEAIEAMAATRGFWYALFDIARWDYRRYLIYPEYRLAADEFVDDPTNLKDMSARMLGILDGSVSMIDDNEP